MKENMSFKNTFGLKPNPNKAKWGKAQIYN